MEYISNDFLEEVVNVLKAENNQKINENSGESQINIPFAISVICQCLNDKKYKSFIEDISNYNYNIFYRKCNDDYIDYGKLIIELYNIKTDKNNWDSSPVILDYTYSIILSHDPREWGYCECTSEDEDYREDKECCGHGCDWWAPAVRIIKEYEVGTSLWHGDEHDYWDFEDSFYGVSEELAKETKIREKKEKIQYYEEQMKFMLDKIDKLKKQLD